MTGLFLSALTGCGNTDDAEQPAPMTQPKPLGTSTKGDGYTYFPFQDDLKRASSEAEKWQMTLRHYQGDETYAKEQIAFFLKVCHPTAAFVKYYPNVTKKLQLDTSYLAQMSVCIGSDETLVYGCSEASITAGEVADLWLKHLTGREFKDKAEFWSWFRANREYLKWNQEAGKFEIRRPQTSRPRGAPRTSTSKPSSSR